MFTSMRKSLDGAAQLGEYMKVNALTREDVAVRVKTSSATVSRLVSRTRGPGISLGLRIQRVLGIPIEAWSEKPKRKSQAA